MNTSDDRRSVNVDPKEIDRNLEAAREYAQQVCYSLEGQSYDVLVEQLTTHLRKYAAAMIDVNVTGLGMWATLAEQNDQDREAAAFRRVKDQLQMHVNELDPDRLQEDPY